MEWDWEGWVGVQRVRVGLVVGSERAGLQVQGGTG